jgi:hypothetical protein
MEKQKTTFASSWLKILVWEKEKFLKKEKKKDKHNSLGLLSPNSHFL